MLGLVRLALGDRRIDAVLRLTATSATAPAAEHHAVAVALVVKAVVPLVHLIVETAESAHRHRAVAASPRAVASPAARLAPALALGGARGDRGLPLGEMERVDRFEQREQHEQTSGGAVTEADTARLADAAAAQALEAAGAGDGRAGRAASVYEANDELLEGVGG